MSGTLIDLLLDGVTDGNALKDAWKRQEAEKQRVLDAIGRGEYEEMPEEALD